MAEVPWDEVADVVVVGSGAAGMAAAVSAARAGASVIVLERVQALGGTTAKSGGGFWVPNNPLMREQGIPDPRQGALRYLARIAYPAIYDDTREDCGIPAEEFSLLEAIYDHGAEAVDALIEANALYVNRNRGTPYPDYHADIPQNEAPFGMECSLRDASDAASACGSACDASSA